MAIDRVHARLFIGCSNQMMAIFDKIFPALFKRAFSTLPWWRWFPGAADRELARSVAAVDAAIAGFIAQANSRRTEEAGAGRNL